ncbi:MAG: peptidase M14 [Paracoccaceae bacterium]
MVDTQQQFEAKSGDAMPGAQAVRVRYGVDYTAGNPYQTLLYRAAGPQVQAAPASVAAALAEIAQAPGPMIYHLHWEDHALKGVNAAGAAENVQALIDGLEALKGAGCKLVWTRHNLRPHDAGHEEIHAAMIPHLTAIASVIHLHSWPALEALAETEPVALDKTVVIAHGNYVQHYAGWAAPAARQSFGFDAEAHVFLLFGRLGSYKQVARTAEVFAGIDAPHARLLIAGVPAADDLKALPGDDRITLIAKAIPEAEVGRYFAAADTVLLPYRECLTSGTALLAGGFSRGVLGTDVAGLRDVVRPGVSGMLYAHGGIELAFRLALQEGRDAWLARGQVAGKHAALRDWRGPGRQWRDLFLGLAREPRTGDMTLARIAAP